MTNDSELTLKIVDHMGRTEEKLGALAEVMHDVKRDIHDVKKHNDESVSDLQDHFDMRIEECNKDVMNILNESHLDKTEVRDAITKAVKASEKRTFTRLTFFGAAVGGVIAFIYGYSEPIINTINMLRGK